ncbi:hypothetical protein BU15DRAFT_59240 [Melanogaster broomeanus]|nr:hypothetical protein BU15DRAFT_59240 [Melanogaster broomeanus]
MPFTESAIPSPLTYTHAKRQPSNACTLPYLVQHLNGAGIDLLTLVSSIRATIASHASWLSRPLAKTVWFRGKILSLTLKFSCEQSLQLRLSLWQFRQGEADLHLTIYRDVVHVCTQERLDEIITTGSTSDALAPDCTRFYILVDADNRPSQLVFLGGPLFYNHTTLLHVLHLIDSCCRSSPIVRRVLPPSREPKSKEIRVDSERYWLALLSGFNLAPLTEHVRNPSASASVCVTRPSPDFGDSFPGQLKYEDVRLSMLNAWAVVLSYHAGSQDIVVAEVLTDDVSEVSLVPRRIEFISATPAQDQLSIQMAQDPIHARVSWDVAKEVLGEAIHSIAQRIILGAPVLNPTAYLISPGACLPGEPLTRFDTGKNGLLYAKRLLNAFGPHVRYKLVREFNYSTINDMKHYEIHKPRPQETKQNVEKK